jgi:DNA-binding NarL/FixJ family response regulator
MPALVPGLKARLPDLAVAGAAGIVAGTLGVGLLAAAGVAIGVGLYSELARRHAPKATAPAEPPRPRGDLYPLTRAEAEVARLVAEGLTNREIAARIWRGERAVETRIQNCFNRLGLHNRSELTRWVIEHDTVPPVRPVPKSPL